jgi:hypothetical protein
MAIHYATGTAADGHAALRAVGTFASGTLGWTEDVWTTGGGESRLHLHKGTMYWSLWAEVGTGTEWCGDTELSWYGRMCTGYDSGAAVDAQPGQQPGSSFCNLIGDGVDLTWHAYGGTGADGDYVHMVVERGAGAVGTLHMGVLSPSWVGGVNGGQFLAANQRGPTSVGYFFEAAAASQHYLRADIDGAAAPAYLRASAHAQRPVSAANIDPAVRGIGQSAASGTTPLWPLHCWLNRPDSYYSVGGTFPGIRECRLDLLTAGQELTLGAAVWQVWPAIKRGPGAAEVKCDHSGWRGFAYRKS